MFSKKPTRSVLLSVFILCLAVTVVFAEEGQGSASSGSNRGKELKSEKIERELKENLEKRKSANLWEGSNSGRSREKLASDSSKREEQRENAVARIKEFFKKMHGKMVRAIAKEENLIGRIESRLAKLQAEGQDVTRIQIKVADAKAKLAKAKIDLAALDAKVTALNQAQDQKQVVQSILTDVNNIKKQLIEVHRILQSTIPDIKGLRPSKEGSGSASRSGERKPLPTRRPVATVSGVPLQ